MPEGRERGESAPDRGTAGVVMLEGEGRGELGSRVRGPLVGAGHLLAKTCATALLLGVLGVSASCAGLWSRQQVVTETQSRWLENLNARPDCRKRSSCERPQDLARAYARARVSTASPRSGLATIIALRRGPAVGASGERALARGRAILRYAA
jgi:hypothetical protein